MINKDDEQLLLSIIIPVYNRQKGLDLLLADLSKASISNNLDHSNVDQIHIDNTKLARQIEVIVIDDASINPITLVQVPYKITLKRNQINSGAPYSREKGFQLSKGRFIHFHDSDDSISNNWLSELIKELLIKSDIDILVTGRIDHEHHGKTHRYPKFFNKQIDHVDSILTRLLYWNCIGPMGGVTFSRQILQTFKIKKMASCQDWQMYIDAIKNTKQLTSRPDIQFLFHKTGNDRISHNPRKKILGHLQLSKQTGKDSIFGRNIRLFYLHACKHHVSNHGGAILKFYKKHQLRIIAIYLIIAIYSFLPRFKNR